MARIVASVVRTHARTCVARTTILVCNRSLARRIASDNPPVDPHGRESPAPRPRTRWVRGETKGRVRGGVKEPRIYGGESRSSVRVIIGQIAMRTDEL